MKARAILLLLLCGCGTAFADCILKEDEARADFALGVFVDESDGDTVETGLTISQSDVIIKKAGSTTFAQKNDATSCTHRSNGFYTCPLDATDTEDAGNLVIVVNESGALPVWRECVVYAANMYDAIHGTNNLNVDLEAGAVDSTSVATGAIDADALAADAGTEIGAAVLATTITEPSGVFSWPPTLAEVVGWLGALSRNEVQQTSTTKTIRNDADTGNISTCATSDNGTTFQRDECS